MTNVPTDPAAAVPASDAPTRLDGTLVHRGRRTARASVVLDQGLVAYSGPTAELPAQWAELRTPPGWKDDVLLLPGLVDLHHHGGAGGEYGPDPDACRTALDHHRRHGSTSLVASLVSNFPDALDNGVATCAALVAEGELEGIHLEGPFLSFTRRGAQNPAALTDVDLALVERLTETSARAGAPDALVQMTFAPERPGAAALPAVLARHGIVGAVGHTDCSADEARHAIDQVVRGGARSGAALATHVFNGMRPLHHRDPGPIAGCLAAAARGETVLEVIGDGVHLDPGTVRMMFDLVGPDSLALITDALSACGMPPGRYTLGDLDIVVDDEVCRLAEGDSIAGSIATMIDVLRWTTGVVGIPLADAVTAATSTPARAGGLTGVGDLEVGSRGDVLVLDETDQGGRPLRLRYVYRCGRSIDATHTQEARP